mmetsp:Transcript_43580/g.137979  ORF Transcript_43580/g.137979 Transcript_43580/m.137979 type:complete len:317 (-) Transcript_43580:672-1622(-)
MGSALHACIRCSCAGELVCGTARHPGFLHAHGPAGCPRGPSVGLQELARLGPGGRRPAGERGAAALPAASVDPAAVESQPGRRHLRAFLPGAGLSAARSECAPAAGRPAPRAPRFLARGLHDLRAASGRWRCCSSPTTAATRISALDHRRRLAALHIRRAGLASGQLHRCAGSCAASRLEFSSVHGRPGQDRQRQNGWPRIQEASTFRLCTEVSRFEASPSVQRGGLSLSRWRSCLPCGRAGSRPRRRDGVGKPDACQRLRRAELWHRGPALRDHRCGFGGGRRAARGVHRRGRGAPGAGLERGDGREVWKSNEGR